MQSNKYKRLNLPLAIALLFLLIGLFARINDWSLGFEMALLGFLVVGFLYGTRYSLKIDKTLKDRLKAYTVFSFVMVEVLTMLTIKSVLYFQYLSLIFGFIWLILELMGKIKNVKSNNKPNLVLNIGVLFLVLSVSSRLLAWPCVFITLFTGVFSTSIGFLLAYFQDVKSKKI